MDIMDISTIDPSEDMGMESDVALGIDIPAMVLVGDMDMALILKINLVRSRVYRAQNDIQHLLFAWMEEVV
jgi:hypothetical protein